MSWTLVDSTAVLNSRWLRVYRNTYRLATGEEIDDFYIVERDHFVLVVAERDDSVVLVRQYRPATERSYYSLPAGYIRPGDTPESTAQRELGEETGLTPTSCVIVGELHPLPGYVRSFDYVVRCGALGSPRVRDQREIESVSFVRWREVVEMIKAGEINEMQAVAALLLVRALGAGSMGGEERG